MNRENIEGYMTFLWNSVLKFQVGVEFSYRVRYSGKICIRRVEFRGRCRFLLMGTDSGRQITQIKILLFTWNFLTCQCS